MSGKIPKKPYTHQVERAKDLPGLIHTDVCGPFKIMSRQRASYFITFTDDFSRYGYVYLLKHKHEVFETFKVFQKKVENQLGKTIKLLRSNRGGEYTSQEFLERRNRTLLDMVEKTPYEIWHGQAPELSYLKVWGCEALVKIPKRNDWIFFLLPTREQSTCCSKAEFLENSLINQEASGSLEDVEIIQEEDMHPSIDTSLNHEEDDLKIDEPQSDIVSIHRSTRTRRAADRMCLYINAEEHELGDLGEPANYKVALLDP
nr:hypothetical protein [Tanacetum cinerariifolium]